MYLLSFQDCWSLDHLSFLSLQSLDRWEADFAHALEKIVFKDIIPSQEMPGLAIIY